MSCDGLLRSLMFQIVSAVPDCIPTVFSHCVEACLLFGDRSLRRDFGEWTWDELLTCFRNLIAMISTTYRIAFFIDGMDEFMGKPTYLIDLINTLDLPNVSMNPDGKDVWNMLTSIRSKSAPQAVLGYNSKMHSAADPTFDSSI